MKLTLIAAAALGALAMTLSPGGITEAGAMCDSPEPAILPAPGTPLPPDPTLYAFDPDHNPKARLIVEGAEASIERVAESPAYDVTRIRVHARAPGHEIRLYWRDGNGSTSRPAHYRVGAATPPNQARVVGVTRHTWDWTCSFADTIKLELEGTAIAYRVAWADGSTTFLPADDRVMWPGNADDAAALAPARITAAELGHINCMGYSVAPEALARPRPFVLYALYADGSEVRIGSAIAQLGEDGVRLPVELVADAGEIAPQRVIPADGARDAAEAAEAPEAPEATDDDPAPGAAARQALIRLATALGMVGGVIALVGAALLRRRRDHAPRL
jgi:hypothetical protein